MAQIQALVDEISNDPLGRGYASMSNEDVSSSLNSTKDRPGVVDMSDIKAYVLLQKIWGKCQYQAHHGTDRSAQELCFNFIGLIDSLEAVNFANSAAMAGISFQLTEMVVAGLVTAEQRTELLALGDNLQTRGQELNLGRVVAGDIDALRGVI